MVSPATDPPSESEQITFPSCVDPVRDMDGLCHCKSFVNRHPPVLPHFPGQSFPPCRDPSLRLLYIDDALLATTIKIDKVCVPLLPTLGPHAKLASCVWYSIVYI